MTGPNRPSRWLSADAVAAILTMTLFVGMLGVLEQLFLFALTDKGFSDVAMTMFGTLMTTSGAALFQLLRWSLKWEDEHASQEQLELEVSRLRSLLEEQASRLVTWEQAVTARAILRDWLASRTRMPELEGEHE